jgi:DNA-binding NarL/FixJ family response regulator
VTTISVLLVDAHILFRKGLAALLAQDHSFMVLEEFESGKDVLAFRSAAIPDIVLMDIRLGGIAGLDVICQIKRRLPQSKVVLLTSQRAEDYVRAALKAGIDGYLLKDASLEELQMALRSVVRGKKYLSPDVSGSLVETFLHPESTNKKCQGDMLTNRERGVLQLIAEGRTNKSAADILCVSAKTVEKYRANLMQKLGLRNATELILAAMALGLVERPASITRLMGDVCGGCDALPLAGAISTVSRHEPIPIRSYLYPV